MRRNRFAMVAFASICSFALGGCYFASGINYDEPAFRYTTAGTKNPYTIELRTRPWHTGNAHIPFDFTVYRYDETYEVMLPREVGSFSKNDIELIVCGVPLVVVAATVDVTRDLIKFDIEYNFQTGSAREPWHLVGSVRVVEASAASRACAKPRFYVRPTASTAR